MSFWAVGTAEREAVEEYEDRRLLVHPDRAVKVEPKGAGGLFFPLSSPRLLLALTVTLLGVALLIFAWHLRLDSLVKWLAELVSQSNEPVNGVCDVITLSSTMAAELAVMRRSVVHLLAAIDWSNGSVDGCDHFYAQIQHFTDSLIGNDGSSSLVHLYLSGICYGDLPVSWMSSGIHLYPADQYHCPSLSSAFHAHLRVISVAPTNTSWSLQTPSSMDPFTHARCHVNLLQVILLLPSPVWDSSSIGDASVALDSWSDQLIEEDPRLQVIEEVKLLSCPSTAVSLLLKHQWLDPTEQDFLDAFRGLQLSNEACDARRYLVWGLQESGFASNVHVQARMMRHAVASGRTFVVVKHFTETYRYSDEDVCRSRGYHISLECSFLGHRLFSRPPCSDFIDAILHSANRTALLTDSGHHRSMIWYSQWPTYVEFNDAVRNAYLNSHQLTHYTTPLVRLLLNRPRSYIRKEVTRRIQRLNLPSHYLGLHIRHGDKSWEIGVNALHSFSSFMQQIEPFVQSSGVRTVYVATDNETIVAEDIHSSAYEAFQFVAQPMDRGGGLAGQSWASTNTSKTELMLSVVVDLTVLVRAHVFLGTQESGFTQLVQHLRRTPLSYGLKQGLLVNLHGAIEIQQRSEHIEWAGRVCE